MAELSRRKFVGAVGAGVATLALSATQVAADPQVSPPGDVQPVGTKVGPSTVVAPPGDVRAAVASNKFAPPAPTSPQTWWVTVGAESDDMQVSAMGYYPKEIWINNGDTVTWKFASAEPHTVTLITPAAANSPDLGQNPFIPASGGNTVTAASLAPNADIINSGPLNSGGVFPPGKDTSTVNTYSLTFDVEGDFNYACLFHSNMLGTIHVRPAGTWYPFAQAYYSAQAAMSIGEDLRHGWAMVPIAESYATRNAGGPNVVAGYGDGAEMLMRFYPQDVTVNAGSVVTWTDLDPMDPHTVTFGTEPSDALTNPLPNYPGFDPNSPGPQTAPVDYSGTENIHSGYLGAFFPAGTTFRIRFTKPGTYKYICALHDEMGMVGTVTVV